MGNMNSSEAWRREEMIVTFPPLQPQSRSHSKKPSARVVCGSTYDQLQVLRRRFIRRAR